MAFILIIGGVLCAWVFLTLLGGERNRRLSEMKNAKQQAESTAEAR